MIDLISSELQSRMTYTTIDTYLRGHHIDLSKANTNQNSKRLYSQSILANVDNKLLFKIADELNIDHNYYLEDSTVNLDSLTFWKEGYFRLFLSHLSKFKVNTAYLQKELLKYGISSFVAHNDIEPTKLWQNEIEKGATRRYTKNNFFQSQNLLQAVYSKARFEIVARILFRRRLELLRFFSPAFSKVFANPCWCFPKLR